MVRDVLILGGGTAGWITAAYLAKRLSVDLPDGLTITLVESADIGILGVGEGTFPSIRKTLRTLGISEADLIRDCSATLKQGIRFDGWRTPPTSGGLDSYFHPFQAQAQSDGLDLMPYWLLGAGGDKAWSEVSTVQQRVAYQARAPKLASHPDYAAPLQYAYHFDATKFAGLLRKTAIGYGVRHLIDTIDEVKLTPDGAIDVLRGRTNGELKADLFIDCSGFAAELIGKALKVPFRSYRDQLFTNRAVAIQVPYEQPDSPIPSCTISTAKDAGWIWDIGLDTRRGTGYVYSADHSSDEEAEATLRRYLGPEAEGAASRVLKFEPGIRETQWVKNCVSIGLSSGFIEPLEATGIGFAEIAALVLSNIFPWAGDFETSAKQFNQIMLKRYRHVSDFIKLHYCLTQRNDTDFWRDNVAPESISEDLKDRLNRYQYRAPSFVDVDLNHDVFLESNWQYVLYGMGFQTDLSASAGAYRYFEEARTAFAAIEQQAVRALELMPTHRDLIAQVKRHGFIQRAA